jgi:hypothetical protein
MQLSRWIWRLNLVGAIAVANTTWPRSRESPRMNAIRASSEATDICVYSRLSAASLFAGTTWRARMDDWL